MRTINKSTALGRIVKTDASCIINGRNYPGIPTLVWPEGIDEQASSWLRDLMTTNGIPASSAYEYAKILRPFLRFCRMRGRRWDSVDDHFLIIWREHMRSVDKADIPRINTSLRTIFAFYRWAEQSRHLRYHVGIYDPADLPVHVAEMTFAISAKKIFSNSRHGKVHSGWTTCLTLTVPRTSQGRRHTPTEEETRELHEKALNHQEGERDSLLYSWAEEVGARRADLTKLLTSHMPTIDQLADLIDKDEPWDIQIVRKGGGVWHLHPLPDLLIRTIDWIGHGRAEIVKRCRDTLVGYKEPPEILISARTGMPLHLDSITKIGNRDFAAAGIKNASIHRLRARYCVHLVESLVDAVSADDLLEGSKSNFFETILTKAAEQMGHMSPMSLRPYLNYVLDRKLRTADPAKARILRSSIRQLELHQQTLVRRLSKQDDLQAAAKLIGSGDNDQAAAALRRLADKLSDATET